MSDIGELVKRAKRFAVDMRNHRGPPETCPSPSDYDMEDIADAFEAQAARVKELEAELAGAIAQMQMANAAGWEKLFESEKRSCEFLRLEKAGHVARISVLEAQVKALREAAETARDSHDDLMAALQLIGWTLLTFVAVLYVLSLCKRP